MRVIAGSARGRRLAAPPGRDVRPTSDRVREALFSALAPVIPGARVLDLFAGSGALAIEALSRGAEHAVLVERDRRALAVIRDNLDRAEVGDRATVCAEAAEAFAHAPRGGRFDVVLVDPPYAVTLPAVHALLTALETAQALADALVVVVERDKRDPDLDLAPPAFLAPGRRRSYGDTVLLSHQRAEESLP